MNEFAQQLIFHGSIILLIGLLAGFPYARVILKKREDNIIHAWRIAHQSLPIGAILLFALAAFVALLDASNATKWTLSILFIVSAYAFAFALILGPIVGERGLTSRGPMSAKLVYSENIVGVITSLIGALLLVYSAWASL